MNLDITAKPVILFLHVYKTGGTSNRELFANWAESEGARFAQAGSCPDGQWMSKLEPNNHDYICLLPLKGTNVDADGRTQVDMPTPRPSQMEIVAEELDVIAGHFAWGFDHFVHRSHKYVTCLRNPTARYVSDILYANRFTHKTSEMTLEQTVALWRSTSWPRRRPNTVASTPRGSRAECMRRSRPGRDSPCSTTARKSRRRRRSRRLPIWPSTTCSTTSRSWG